MLNEFLFIFERRSCLLCLLLHKIQYSLNYSLKRVDCIFFRLQSIQIPFFAFFQRVFILFSSTLWLKGLLCVFFSNAFLELNPSFWSSHPKIFFFENNDISILKFIYLGWTSFIDTYYLTIKTRISILWIY